MDTKAIAAGFAALSDPIRLEITALLRHQEFSVGELCERLNLKQSKVSFHIKVLKDAALLRSRQQGRWIYYSLNLPQFVLLEQYVAEYSYFHRLAEISPPSSS